MEKKKKRLDKQKEANIKLEMIYNWIHCNTINVHEFKELLNHIRQGVSKSAMDRKKMPYTGNEDSELTLP